MALKKIISAAEVTAADTAVENGLATKAQESLLANMVNFEILLAREAVALGLGGMSMDELSIAESLLDRQTTYGNAGDGISFYFEGFGNARADISMNIGDVFPPISVHVESKNGADPTVRFSFPGTRTLSAEQFASVQKAMAKAAEIAQKPADILDTAKSMSAVFTARRRAAGSSY